MHLPLFPLRMLPLPGEFVNLRIFEPRYQQLFNELEDMELEEFGIPCAHEGQIRPTGAVMRLVNVSRRGANGQRDVTVKATGLFRLESFDMRDEKVAYPLGKAAEVPDWKSWCLDEDCRAVRDTLVGLMVVHCLDPKPLEQEGLIAVLSHLERDPVQRAKILEVASLSDMQHRLKQHLELAVQILAQTPQDDANFFVN
jgi:Lon protease-like protein|tara:strand:- start:1408 stop:2001 length:594 start_codon:yes stop_codon:yes gene_type:complete